MDTASRVQILREAKFILHTTNTLEKGMNPIIGQDRFFILGYATSLGEGKPRIQTY